MPQWDRACEQVSRSWADAPLQEIATNGALSMATRTVPKTKCAMTTSPTHVAAKPDHRHRRLLRPRRERPRDSRAAKCGQQFPPSDGDCHTPLPCEVRKRDDTTPRACSLAVQGGQGCWSLRPQFLASTALLPPPAPANAAMAASRVGSNFGARPRRNGSI